MPHGAGARCCTQTCHKDHGCEQFLLLLLLLLLPLLVVVMVAASNLPCGP
jgi:hypothetical protein